MSKNGKKALVSRYLEQQKQLEIERAEHHKNLCRKKLEAFYNDCLADAEKGVYDGRLAVRLKYIIDNKDVYRPKICEFANVDKGTLSRIINNKVFPRFENFLNIFVTLDFNEDVFVDYSDDTAKWIKIQDTIKNGVYDELLDYHYLPKDIEDTKNRMFLELDSYIYTYNKNGKVKTIPSQYIDLLRRQVLNAFDSLEILLENKK